MKASPRTIRRSTESHDRDHDRLVIQLPHPQVLRLIARSVLLAAAILSFPWLHTIFKFGSPTAAVAATSESKWVDDPFLLPMLINDLKREGLFNSDGCTAVYLGDPSSRLPFLKKNQIDPISDYKKPMVGDNSVDFVLAADGLKDSSFSFIDRVLKVGGVITVRLGSDPSESFHLPSNYRMAYIRRFGSTVVAIKKVSHANAGDFKGDQRGRRLLSVPKSKNEALNGLEDVFLEPPTAKEKHRKRTRYLPDLMGDDSLDGYPRRVFVDVGPAGRMGNLEWFERDYPKKNREFEIIRVDLVEGEEGGRGMTEWLERNVREEDYVVMKAEAEVVEEMLKERVIGLVDELFLECKNQWEINGKRRSKRAYWECLGLYGRVRDEGIAVHQW